MGNAANPRHPSARPEDTISEWECEAMAKLDADPDYSRSEIAFMFECGARTVARHCDEECVHHSPVPTTTDSGDGPGRGRPQKYDREDCVAAFKVVNDECQFKRMSAGLYDERRSSIYPSSDTIINHFGSWVEARKAILGDGDRERAQVSPFAAIVACGVLYLVVLAVVLVGVAL